jgi:hypothetical protein
MTQDLKTKAYERGIQAHLKSIAESGSDVHQNHTPAEICDMMLDKLDLSQPKSVLVLYNIELLFALKKRKFSGPVTFFTQSQEKADLAPKIFSNLTVEYIDKEENPLYHMETKWPDKFDIVIGNPPYQRPKGDTPISQGKNLYLDFITKSSLVLKDNGRLIFIGPPNFLKPTDGNKKTKSFSHLNGLQIEEMETGIENRFNRKIGTYISLLICKKNNSKPNKKFKIDGIIWDLDEIPFISPKGGKSLEILKKIWPKISNSSLGDRFRFKRMKPEEIKDNYKEGTISLFPRMDHNRKSKFGEMVWFESFDNIGKVSQIVNLNYNSEKINNLFSKKLFKIINYITFSEPTVYHNLLNGIIEPKRLLEKEDFFDDELYEFYGFDEKEIEYLKDLKINEI